eukprot:241843-Prymnesium_polylepis.1
MSRHAHDTLATRPRHGRDRVLRITILCDADGVLTCFIVPPLGWSSHRMAMGSTIPYYSFLDGLTPCLTLTLFRGD